MQLQAKYIAKLVDYLIPPLPTSPSPSGIPRISCTALGKVGNAMLSAMDTSRALKYCNKCLWISTFFLPKQNIWISPGQTIAGNLGRSCMFPALAPHCSFCRVALDGEIWREGKRGKKSLVHLLLLHLAFPSWNLTLDGKDKTRMERTYEAAWHCIWLLLQLALAAVESSNVIQGLS